MEEKDPACPKQPDIMRNGDDLVSDGDMKDMIPAYLPIEQYGYR
jgi:hypothetical protein